MNQNKTILILGVNGFIGSALATNLIQHSNWNIYGFDLSDNKLGDTLTHERFHFHQGDIFKDKEWLEQHVQKCDVVMPLVAIANPSIYVSDPLRVFELDFEANLEIVRLCVKYNKRLIFPSTSEVYGMCTDEVFHEDTSPLILGPIHKQRWIYSCSKQMLDRVIYAYGERDNLDYTLFRPFNWLGPLLDQIVKPCEGRSRVVTQFISDIIYKKKITLVDGGAQRRAFTDIDDGISALLKIIFNEEGKASKRIFNVGNPYLDLSISELAHLILDLMKTYPHLKALADSVVIENIDSKEHYGEGYQDVQRRVPSIESTKTCLDWQPKVSMEDSLRKVIEHHLAKGSSLLV